MSNLQLPFLLESEQLYEHINDPNLLLVDVRIVEDYIEGHIPGALQLNYTDIVRHDPPVGGLLPTEQQLSAVLSALGLTPDYHVVAYDDEGGGHAGRLLWTLDALGHKHMSLLNGGVIAWTQAGLGRDSTPREPVPSDYQAHLANPDVVASKSHIMARLGQADFIPFDVRTPGEFAGTDVRAARGGHIPGAVNMNWIEAIDRSNGLRFKPDATLRAMLEQRGVTLDKEVVAYCQTHHRSSHAYMVLKHLGYSRARGYPGSWSEWGNDSETPVEM